MPAPQLLTLSQSSARSLRLRGADGTTHWFTYQGEDCIAYQRTGGGRVLERMRLGATAEVWRLAFHEFGCMDWPVVDPDAFDKRLPTLRITTP